MKPSDLPIPKEAEEQAAFIRWCSFNEKRYPGLDLIRASLNGLKLTIGQAKKAKLQGMKKGEPDIFLPVSILRLWGMGSTEKYHGLYIEMKRTKGGTLSKPQKDYIKKLRDNDYKVVVAKGCDEAIAAIKEYYE